MKDTYKKDVTEELKTIKRYVKPKIYAMISAFFDEKIGKKLKKRFGRRRKKSNEEQIKEFIGAVGKIGVAMYGVEGKDTRTIINVMELMFVNHEYKLIGKLAEMMEPDENDEVGKSIKNRLMNSRSNLTEFRVPEWRKEKNDKKEI